MIVRTTKVSSRIPTATRKPRLNVNVTWASRWRPRASTSSGITRRRSAPTRPARSQELVDRFLAAGAALIFVGPNTGLRGPPGRVEPLANHDNHLHVRLPR
jgi:hypothetical protein